VPDRCTLDGGVDLVAQLVSVFVREGALQVAQHYPQQHVLLPWGDPEPGYRGGREVAIERLREHLDALDARGARGAFAQGAPHLVAEFFGCLVSIHRNGQVAPDRGLG
jgi:hypothetical protein